jgi:hypothetical protein
MAAEAAGPGILSAADAAASDYAMETRLGGDSKLNVERALRRHLHRATHEFFVSLERQEVGQ